MNRKVAILYSGSSYNVKFSLPTQLKNLVEPNDADVFVFTTKLCKRRKTIHNGEIPDASENEKWNEKVSETLLDQHDLRQSEIDLIKETFGERLKGFKMAEDDLGYMAYLITKRTEMMEIINRYIDESFYLKVPAPFRGIRLTNPNNPMSNGALRCVIDQYNHLKKCYEMMEEYERENNVKYEWIVRARIDFIVPFEFNLKHYYENLDQPYVYIAGSFRRDEMSWMDEFFFFTKRITAEKLFPHLDRMGMIKNRKHNTIQYNTPYAPDGNDLNFDPEVQFSLLLHELNLTQLINVRIFRSGMYTQDGEYDYFNYVFQRSQIDLNYEFELVKNCETDINEHAETLKRYAQECEHVTEMGIRFGNSTVMFMAAYPKKFVSYDVFKEERVNYLELIAKECGINWELKIMNPSPEDATESQIEETDLLFIDTNHFKQQLELELRLHAPKTRKYIIMHDVETFGSRGAGDDHIADGMNLAIEPFLENHKGVWEVAERFKNNNGLLILKRVGL